jgi:hypothetical protein
MFARLSGVGLRCGELRLLLLIGHLLISFLAYVTNKSKILAGARISVPRVVQRGQPVNFYGNNGEC